MSRFVDTVRKANEHAGERVGCVFFVMEDEDVAIKSESVLEQLQRSEVSNPPAYGAKVASKVLSDERLRSMWYDDLTTMSSRILSMRHALYDKLVEYGKFDIVCYLQNSSIAS